MTETPIAERLPHAGAMVLIDSVLEHGESHIICRANTGPIDEHPLARNGRLPATALAEYGAQATAVHGSLLGGDAPLRPGRLVALPELNLACATLDEATELTIHAERLGGTAVGESYRFSVSSKERMLARGRATIMFPETGSAP
jgi:predicted hotdog family 3-hydroxylacyl-ACP dehydratase